MKGKNIIIAFVLILSISFIGIGILLKQYNDVIEKGINLCLECIGIG